MSIGMVGYSQTNPMMLAAYLEVMTATPTVAQYLLSGRRYTVEFVTMIVLIAAAFGYALMTGAMTNGTLTAMRWLTPPWIALYLCAHADILPAIRDGVQRLFRLALPAVAIYGIVQFVDIAPWDAYFMEKAPINSIGFPVPFAVRVFATMNSPGSLAAMLGTGLLLLLPATKGVRWVGIVLAIAALLLTTQRAALGGLVVAVSVLLAVGRNRTLRRSLVGMLATAAVVIAVMLSIPGAGKKVMAVADSLTALNKDDSAQARLQQYHEVFPMLDEQMLGRGLGWSTNKLYVSVGKQISLDSGVIDIFVSLGLPGGALFLVILAALVFQALRIALAARNSFAVAEFGGAIFGVVQLPLGSQNTGEHGIFLYLSLGLLLARAVPIAAWRMPLTVLARRGWHPRSISR